MQQLHGKYGEVLFIDGTYKINKNDYSYYLMIVEDGNGHSQVVGVSLCAFERNEIIQSMMNFFADNNDISITKTIMTASF